MGVMGEVLSVLVCFDPAMSESCVPLLTECNQQGKHALELENLEH